MTTTLRTPFGRVLVEQDVDLWLVRSTWNDHELFFETKQEAETAARSWAEDASEAAE